MAAKTVAARQPVFRELQAVKGIRWMIDDKARLCQIWREEIETAEFEALSDRQVLISGRRLTPGATTDQGRKQLCRWWQASSASS